MKAAKGTPTRTNLYVLEREIARGAGIIGHLPSTSIPHVRRCLAAGLLEQAGAAGFWRLTPAGVDALAAHRPIKDRAAAYRAVDSA